MKVLRYSKQNKRSLLAAALLSSTLNVNFDCFAESVEFSIERIRPSEGQFNLSGQPQDILADGTIATPILQQGAEATLVMNAETGKVHHVVDQRVLVAIASKNVVADIDSAVLDLRSGVRFQTPLPYLYDLSLRPLQSTRQEKELGRVQGVGARYDYFARTMRPFFAGVVGGQLNQQILLGPDGTPAHDTYATQMNSRGQIVGHAVSGLSSGALVWSSPSATAQQIRNLNYIVDLNEAGQFVGIGADIFGPRNYVGAVGGELTELAPLPGEFNPVCQVRAISQTGEIIGHCSDGQLIRWKNRAALPETISLESKDGCDYFISGNETLRFLNNGSIVTGANVSGGNNCPQQETPVILRHQ